MTGPTATNSVAVSDATLARSAGAGDPAALGTIYDRYAGRLLGLCQSMLGNPIDAEDCLQEIFSVAATNLRELPDPAQLRSWLFAVARAECLTRLDRRRRDVVVRDLLTRPDPDSYSDSDDDTTLFDSELGALLDDTTEGLSDRDRLLLELADRQGLAGTALADAIGVSPAAMRALVARARANARSWQGALLVGRTGRDGCPQLAASLGDWDGQLTTRRARQINRHVDSCTTCSAHRNRVATPLALLGEGQAYAAESVALRGRILSTAAAAVASVAATSVASAGPGGPPVTARRIGWIDGWPPADPQLTGSDRGARRWAAPATVLAVLVVAIALIIGFILDSGGSSKTKRSNALAQLTTAATSGGTDSSGLSGALPGADVSTSAASPTPSPKPSITKKATKVAVPPKSASHAPTSTAPHLVLVYLTTDADPAQVGSGRLGYTCASHSTCPFSITTGESMTVSTAVGRIRLRYDTFSAPPSCRGVRDTCTFVVTSALSITLTTQGGIVQPQ